MLSIKINTLFSRWYCPSSLKINSKHLGFVPHIDIFMFNQLYSSFYIKTVLYFNPWILVLLYTKLCLFLETLASYPVVFMCWRPPRLKLTAEQCRSQHGYFDLSRKHCALSRQCGQWDLNPAFWWPMNWKVVLIKGCSQGSWDYKSEVWCQKCYSDLSFGRHNIHCPPKASI